jgi:hypothetical protein
MKPSLQQMLSGYVPAQILYVTAELGLADALADGPRGYEYIASQTETDPAALRRLLRALVGLGLVAQLDAGRFALTESGEQLRADAPGSLSADILLSVSPELWNAWGDLDRVIRTGEPARDPFTQRTAQETLLQDPVFAAAFRTARARASQEFAAGVAAVYDFSKIGLIADFGGDHGTLMAAILAAEPDLRGVLYDLPAAFEATAATLAAAGVAGRCEVTAGSVTEPVRPGAGAYVLNHVIHSHPDDNAIAILRNCRAAMSPDARLLVVETVMPPVLSPGDSATYGLTDLNNLVYAGGRERSADEYRDLLTAAGLAMTTLTSVPTTNDLPNYNVIEAVPAD